MNTNKEHEAWEQKIEGLREWRTKLRRWLIVSWSIFLTIAGIGLWLMWTRGSFWLWPTASVAICLMYVSDALIPRAGLATDAARLYPHEGDFRWTHRESKAKTDGENKLRDDRREKLTPNDLRKMAHDLPDIIRCAKDPIRARVRLYRTKRRYFFLAVAGTTAVSVVLFFSGVYNQIESLPIAWTVIGATLAFPPAIYVLRFMVACDELAHEIVRVVGDNRDAHLTSEQLADVTREKA